MTESGRISDYTTFLARENPASDVHRSFDVVPTGLSFGSDSALYVASFTGFPFPQGATYVYRLEDINEALMDLEQNRAGRPLIEIDPSLGTRK